MKIAIIGDQHGNINNFLSLIDYLEKLENPDLYIQVGDMGVMGNNFEKYLHKLNKKLNSLNKNLLFIDGNHDNHNWLKSITKKKFEVNYIQSNIGYIPRGTLLKIGNTKFFFCGGAFSIDRNLRTLNKDYWIDETLSDEELEEIKSYLETQDLDKIEYFISHDYPLEFSGDFNGYNSQADYYIDYSHKRNLQELFDIVKPHLVINGHYHKYNLNVKQRENSNGLVMNITLNKDNSPLSEQYKIINIR